MMDWREGREWRINEALSPKALSPNSIDRRWERSGLNSTIKSYHWWWGMTQNGSNHFPFLLIPVTIVPSVQTTDYWQMPYHPVWLIWVEEGLRFNEIEQDQTNHCEWSNRSKSIPSQIKWHQWCQIVHNELLAATECRLTKNNGLERRKRLENERVTQSKGVASQFNWLERRKRINSKQSTLTERIVS